MLAWFEDISCDCRRRLRAPGRAFTDSRGFLSAADEEKQKAEPDNILLAAKRLEMKEKRIFSFATVTFDVVCRRQNNPVKHFFLDCRFLVILVQGCGSLFRLFSLISVSTQVRSSSRFFTCSRFFLLFFMSGCLWVLEKLRTDVVLSAREWDCLSFVDTSLIVRVVSHHMCGFNWKNFEFF